MRGAGLVVAGIPLYQWFGEAPFNEGCRLIAARKSGLPGETFDHVHFKTAGAPPRPECAPIGRRGTLARRFLRGGTAAAGATARRATRPRPHGARLDARAGGAAD